MGYVDFRRFTVVDPEPGKISLELKMRISWDKMTRSHTGRCYRRYGKDQFRDFEHKFNFRFSRIEAGEGISRPIMRLWQLGSTSSRNASKRMSLSAVQVGDTSDKFKLRLAQHGSQWRWTGPHEYEANTIYFATVTRIGTNVRVRIFDDADRTSLVEDSGDREGYADAYRYLFVVIGESSGTAPDDHSTGYIENLNVGEVEEYTLTVEVSPEGTGEVGAEPEGQTHAEGTEILLTATPEGGYELDHWDLDDADDGSANPHKVIMDDDHTVIGYFKYKFDGIVISLALKERGVTLSKVE